jgi:hypothetical protein
MNTCGCRYDADLQMFVDYPHEPDRAHLRFLRWLAEHGQMEHQVEGAPVGDYALEALDRPRSAA